MGYCPRCGENSPYGEAASRERRDLRPKPIRVPSGSQVVPIPPDLADGSLFVYAGSRFRVRSEAGARLLEIAD